MTNLNNTVFNKPKNRNKYNIPQMKDFIGDIDQEKSQDFFKERYSFRGCCSKGTGQLVFEVSIIKSKIIKVQSSRSYTQEIKSEIQVKIKNIKTVKEISL